MTDRAMINRVAAIVDPETFHRGGAAGKKALIDRCQRGIEALAEPTQYVADAIVAASPEHLARLHVVGAYSAGILAITQVVHHKEATAPEVENKDEEGPCPYCGDPNPRMS